MDKNGFLIALSESKKSDSGRVDFGKQPEVQKEKDRLESLDSKFFEYPDDLTDLLFAFVGQHPESFGPIPE